MACRDFLPKEYLPAEFKEHFFITKGGSQVKLLLSQEVEGNKRYDGITGVTSPDHSLLLVKSIPRIRFDDSRPASLSAVVTFIN
jgi:hypothetical protein